MMFSGAMRHTLRPVFGRTLLRRPASSMIDRFYKTALKSNMSHVTFVVVGAIFFELIYGMGTEALWDNMNKGVRFFFGCCESLRRNWSTKSTGRSSGCVSFKSAILMSSQEDDEEEEDED